MRKYNRLRLAHMTDIERRIRSRHNGEKFIGRFSMSPIPMFRDIRGYEGEVLDISDLHPDELKIDYPAGGLKPDTFYEFSWSVDETSGEFIVIGEPEEINNGDFLKRLLRINLCKKGGDLAQAVQDQALASDEITGAQHTYLYELLQNANDYPFNNEDVRVRFVLTKNYLFFLHTGAEFDLLNIVGICSRHQGQKADKVGTIGYKGIGFKTVFVKNDYVYLKTGGWSLRFDKKCSSDAKGGGETPWTIMPWPTQFKDLDEDVRTLLSSIPDEFRVQFALRHSEDASQHIMQLAKVFSSGEILLFIPNVTDVEVEVEGSGITHHVTKDKEKWATVSFETPVSQQLKDWVKEDRKNGGKTPKKFENIQAIQISFAVPKDGNVIKPMDTSKTRVFNYLPTELRLGLPFFINADFIPDASRSGLHPDLKWNDTVMGECGKRFVDWFASLLFNEGEYDIASVFSMFPGNYTSTDHYTSLFLNNVNFVVGTADCIPVLKDSIYALKATKEIIYDITGITSGDTPVLTDEEFYRLSGQDGYLPHPNCRNHERLKGILKSHSASVIRFDEKSLASMAKTPKFQVWLKSRENNTKFLRFLLESGYITNFNGEEIILKEGGDLGKASSMYLDIDSRMEDLGFLSDLLPRIDTKERNELSSVKGWNDFKEKFIRFSPNSFISDVLGSSEVSATGRLAIFENSVRFLHFMAMEGYEKPIPATYPLFGEDGSIAGRNSLYVKDDFGEAFSKLPWIRPEWITFLSGRYFERDNMRMKQFVFSNGLKIITQDSACSMFPNNDSKLRYIAEVVNSDITTNILFYWYYANLSVTAQFSENARKMLTVFTTDKETTVASPIRDTIFYKSAEWEAVRKERWLPTSIGRAVADEYLEGDGAERVKSFFSSRSIVQQFTLSGFFSQILEKHRKEIFALITDVESSRSFLDFLFRNSQTFFKGEVPPSVYKDIPVFLQDADKSTTANMEGGIFFHTKDLDELISQPWFPNNSTTVLDHAYDILFDGKERIDFFKKIGLLMADIKKFTNVKVLQKCDDFKTLLSGRENNIAFHQYFSDRQRLFTDDEYAPLKSFPIFISSPDNQEGELADSSSNHYLPSERLTEFIAKDLVPRELMDSVHPDYIREETDREYLMKIGNVEIADDGIISYITQQGNLEYVCRHLSSDRNRSIRFWRWAFDTKISADDKKSLRKLPVLIKGTDDAYMTIESTYIPDEYLESIGEEELVRQFIKGAQFISPDYIEKDDGRDWKGFFKALGVIAGGKDIVFKKVLPNLGDEQYHTLSVVPLIAGYYQDIQKLIATDENLKSELANLHLKRIDGGFDIPDNVWISGKFFDLEGEPIPDVRPGYFVSEEYLEQENPKILRNVKDFMRFIADQYDAACDTKTKVRNDKIQYLYKNQDEFSGDRQIYDRIVRDIADEYAADRKGVSEMLEDNELPDLKLYTTTDQLMDAESLTLGSAFHPDCDLMAGGVDCIDYVDENYASLSSNMKQFFVSALGVREDFGEGDLDYLSYPLFSVYFWKEYAPKHQITLEGMLVEDNLKERLCIPTTSGVRCPKDIYDYRNRDLKTMVDRIYPGGTNTLPAVNLPKWMDYTNVGFRGHLYLEDCLRYLDLKNLNFRRDVITWIVRCDDEIVEGNRDAIDRYLESAEWLNGKKEWVPLKGLVALKKDNKTLDAFFKSNSHVCNPSYMPAIKEDYKRLCDIFDISIITDEDFEKQTDGENHRDDEAIVEIKKRLAYLSFISGKENWAEMFERFVEIIDKSGIRRCERILYRYNDDINTELKVYTDSDDRLWYTKPWNGAPMGDIISWLMRVLSLKDVLKLDEGLMKNVFWDDIETSLHNYEGEGIPQELHDIISALGNINIDVRLEMPEERFTESKLGGDIEPGQEVPTANAEASEGGPARRRNAGDLVANDGEESAIQEVEQTAGIEDGKEPRKDEVRTAYAKSPHDAGGSEKNGPVWQRPQTAETQTRENLEERLLKAWTNRKNTAIRCPAGKVFSPDDAYRSAMKNGTTATAEDFFSGDTHQICTTTPLSKTSQRVSRSYTDARNSMDNARDKVELINLFNEETARNKYSFRWFNLLMEMMYLERRKESRKEIQIEFSECTILADDLVMLAKPSKAIPSWIDRADHLSLTSISSGRTVNAIVSSMTDDALWLTVSQGTHLRGIIDAESKVKINADGTSFTFIDALMTRFIQLGYDIDYNMKDNLPESIQYIYGPPGTGKTTELVRIIKDAIKEGDESSRFIVLAPTNRAADEVAERLLSDNASAARIWRFGTTESMGILTSGHLISRYGSFTAMAGTNVLITTIHRFAYDFLDSSTAICECAWDRVFIDEASMIDIANITYVLHKVSAGTPVVIAGDPMQIQPIEQNDIQPENIYQMVGIDSFSEASRRHDVKTLKRQYRSVREIGELVSRFSYDGQLEHERGNSVEQPLILMGYRDLKKVNFVGFRMYPLDPIYGIDTVALSAFHLYSAILAYNFAEYVAKNVAESGYYDYSVGIVCPYKQQASAIADMLGRRPIDNMACSVKCGTVHKFQGGECDTIIVVMNPPAEVTSGTHANNQNIVNVAISRARDTLFLFVPDHKVENFWTREALGKLSDDHSVTFCGELEKMMFGSENFIERNTTVSCHMPTNVYYEPNKLYEVRIDENAVDIQINENLREG